MYVCSSCKGPLVDFKCTRCRLEFSVVEGIPCFLTESGGGSAQKLREIYDDIYRHHEEAWVDQGRSEPFLRFFSELAQTSPDRKILEIGCGEGMLLATLPSGDRFGIDPSAHALVRARKRSEATCAVARAEQLPFAEAFFDVVITVGVMEHFEDPDAASAEIRRVLKPAGHYLALIETDMTPLERLSVKTRIYVYPRFRPIALLEWAIKRVLHPRVQPFRRSYTLDSARACLERNGLQVTKIITRKTHPDAPLAGQHVVILIARRSAT
jgi:ubiquinone/menaquinone biosynthesis C-methylase UbiE